MRTMHLFAGAGGGLLADLILGHTPVVAVEWNKYACQVLRERAVEGWFPDLNVWEGDVREFDPSEYTGRLDCIHAGFPCQDISTAGRQAGLGEGTRSGLYREVLRIAGAIRPRYIFLENVSAIKSKGLDQVVKDLACMGYDTRWLCIRASDVGAPHQRDRWFLLATDSDSSNGGTEQKSEYKRPEEFNGGCSREMESFVAHTESGGLKTDRQCGELDSPTIREGGGGDQLAATAGGGSQYVADTDYVNDAVRGQAAADANEMAGGRSDARGSFGNCGQGCSQGSGHGACNVADTDGTQREGGCVPSGIHTEHTDSGVEGWWSTEPFVGRVANGVAHRVDRLKAIGNGQVPLQAAVAFTILVNG